MNLEKEQYNQEVKWCPGAESNHRHEDFQSTALPLSYPGTGTKDKHLRLRSLRSNGPPRGCPEAAH